MKDIIEKASVLIESLPYIKKFAGKTFVIKYGGHAMDNDEYQFSFAEDITLLKYIGINIVVVHGGGPQIALLLERLNIKSSFINGMRVTDEATMEIVEMVLAGKINKHIVSLINKAGGRAIGLSGRDANMILAEKLIMKDGNKKIDMGLVGDIKKVDTSILLKVVSEFIPVVAPVGYGKNGSSFNINADIVAGAIASELKAEKLILLTDVDGVLDKDKKRISSIKISDVAKLKKNKTLTGGMIPKIDCASEAIRSGVAKSHIIDGRVKHSLLLEIFTNSGVGTEIING